MSAANHDETYDVVIIGGAVIGSSVAFFLSRHLGFGGRILVVERDPTYATCSTSLSVASIRQQFSTPVNIAISQFGFEFLSGLTDQFGPEADVNLREGGYLLLASPEGLSILKGNHEIQRQAGADIAWLEADDLSARYPWLNTDGVAAGCLGLKGEGWLDPHTLLSTFRREAQNAGVTYEAAQVVDIETRGNRVTAVSLGDGRRIACGAVVNAAGPAAAEVAAMAGIALPVESRKRIVYVIDCREKAAVTDCPLLVDTTGVYCRPEGEYFLSGVSPPADRDPECRDLEVDYWPFEEIVWPALAHRIPVFEAIKVVNAWAGHYAYNLLDQNAVVGPHPEIANFLFANGFSGHGLQQSPAVGRAVAEWIADGRYTSLNLSELGFERITTNRPLLERNVI